MVAMGVTAIWQKFTRKQWVVIVVAGAAGAVTLAGLGYYLRHLSNENATAFSKVVSNGIILLLFITFLLGGL